MAAAVGMLARLGIDSVDPVTARFDFLGSSLKTEEDFVDANGLRGELSHDINRVRAGLVRVQGDLRLQPNATELALLLPWMMGGTPSGSPTVTYPLANTTPTRFVACDFNAGNLHTFAGVAVDTWQFTGAEGQPLELTLSLVGAAPTISGSFPGALSIPSGGPWMFHDLVFVANAVTAQAKSFTIRGENFIDRNRFLNSQTLTAAVKHDRSITVDALLPYGDYVALYGTGAGGVAATATFTNGGAILTFSMVKVAFPRIGPDLAGREETMIRLAGRAYKSGATLELITTLNPGP